ncbi:hypothetical protein L9F63_015721, partial [Diploptera punctata]
KSLNVPSNFESTTNTHLIGSLGQCINPIATRITDLSALEYNLESCKIILKDNTT